MWMTLDDTAEFLNMTKPAVKKALKEGHLVGYDMNKTGRRPKYQFRKEDVEGFLESCRVGVEPKKRKARRRPTIQTAEEFV